MTVPVLPVTRDMPPWEAADRERRNANACEECGYVLPNHGPVCQLAPVPDPSRPQCAGCGLPAGSEACKRQHRAEAAA